MVEFSHTRHRGIGMDQFGYALGAATPFIFGLMVLWAILWVLLPFAVFGIKGLLKDILKELRRANDIRRGY
jgi:hypothetical protein